MLAARSTYARQSLADSARAASFCAGITLSLANGCAALVLLVDVSGSMASYARALLRFHACGGGG